MRGFGYVENVKSVVPISGIRIGTSKNAIEVGLRSKGAREIGISVVNKAI